MKLPHCFIVHILELSLVLLINFASDVFPFLLQLEIVLGYVQLRILLSVGHVCCCGTPWRGALGPSMGR